MTSSAPFTALAGTSTLIWVELTVTSFPAIPPKSTVVASAAVLNPVPEMVTALPGGADAGETEPIARSAWTVSTDSW